MFSSRLEALHFCWSALSLWESIKGSYQASECVRLLQQRAATVAHFKRGIRTPHSRLNLLHPHWNLIHCSPCWDSHVAAFRFPSSKWAISPFCNPQWNVKVGVFWEGWYGLQTPNWAHSALHLLMFPSSATSVPGSPISLFHLNQKVWWKGTGRGLQLPFCLFTWEVKMKAAGRADHSCTLTDTILDGPRPTLLPLSPIKPLTITTMHIDQCLA